MPTQESHKTCANCKVSKPLECFSPNPSMRLKRQSYCKPCVAAKQRVRRKTPEMRATDARLMRDYKRRNRIKMQARNAVKTAVIYGRLVKPKNCSKCGSTIKIQAHHHKGYEPEFWLDVEWLCFNCHHCPSS